MTVRVSSEVNVVDFQIDIYNAIGDLVWSADVKNASEPEYRIWWDGKTTDKTVSIMGKPTDGNYRVLGNRMCRNGRYFAVLTLDDHKKKKQIMKQIVLFK
jgi:hypothetical protein